MTEHDLSSLLRSLREAAPKLNRTTDDATRTIRAVEDFLAGLSLGIPAFVTMDTSSVARKGAGDVLEEVECFTCLHYRKHGNAFRLVVERSEVFQDDDGGGRERILSATPLAEAGRHDKLLAVAQLPALLATIVAEASRVQEAAVKAVGTVDEIAAALSTGPNALAFNAAGPFARAISELEKPNLNK